MDKTITNLFKMKNWKLKSCKKCGGDLRYDVYENIYECLQCGMEHDIFGDIIKKVKPDAYTRKGRGRSSLW